MHPTTLVCARYQLTVKPVILQSSLGTLFRTAAAGHTHSVLCHHLEHTMTALQLGLNPSQPSGEARASGSQALSALTWFYSPRCQQLCPTPLFETDAPAPPGV